MISGGPRNSQPGTLNKLFFDAIAKHNKPDALQEKVDGVYRPISHRTIEDRVRRLQQADDLAERGQALAEFPEPLAEPGNRVEQLHQVEDVGGDRPRRDRPLAIERRADEQDGAAPATRGVARADVAAQARAARGRRRVVTAECAGGGRGARGPARMESRSERSRRTASKGEAVEQRACSEHHACSRDARCTEHVAFGFDANHETSGRMLNHDRGRVASRGCRKAC